MAKVNGKKTGKQNATQSKVTSKNDGGNAMEWFFGLAIEKVKSFQEKPKKNSKKDLRQHNVKNSSQIHQRQKK